jgi:hypothetical protein
MVAMIAREKAFIRRDVSKSMARCKDENLGMK